MTVAIPVASRDERVRSGVIGGVRILTGLLWLANLHWKVPPAFGEDTGGGLFKYSDSVTRSSPFAPFTWVTEEIILPNFRFFGWVVLISELVVAALLLVGWRTKLVAIVGAALTIPILLSVIYYDGADEWSWSYLMMIALNLVLYATDAGRHVGLDGVLERGPRAAQRALVIVGVVATVIGLLGLFVARSISFAGDEAALLGSDAGFVDGAGALVRRWELKFLFFNPLWALLTFVLGLVLVGGSRRRTLAWAGAAGFAVLAVVGFVAGTFDYVRSDGSIQVVSTASNVAAWGAAALAGALLARRLGAAEPAHR
ncbi:MAG: TQO small subunit DoxD [Ilumatobacteraceae bacterium]